MSFDEPATRPPLFRRYDGKDDSVTSNKELIGWYAYSMAAEVFAICGIGSFLPVTIEQLSRETGVFWSDKTTPCISSSGRQNDTDSHASLASLHFRADGQGKNDQCIVTLFGSEITTASFAMYTSSLAVLVQAIALISFSSFADHGPYRKRLLLTFGFTGSITSMLFLFVTPKVYVLGSILAIIGVTCLGSSFTLLNSFLPLLVSNHPQVRGRRSSDIALGAMSSSHRRIERGEDYGISGISSKDSKDSSELQLSAKISSKGVGIGYTAAVFVQCLSILLLFGISKSSLSSSSATIPLRLVLFLVGLWWFAFTIPAGLWLRSRPGPPLDAAVSRRGIMGRSVIAYIAFAWMSVWRTIKVAAKLRQVVIFLISWFLLSDAVATISGTAVIFARTELHMDTVHIAILSITATSSGILGAFTWPMISRKLKLQTNHTIICCIILMETIPLYGLLGYVPFIKAWGVGGLQQAWEIYPLGFVHGFVMGGISSYCRSFFGLLIPPGSEAAFYALYAITDKGSSAVGPAIVGKIVDATGTIRPAFVFLAILIALPGPLIWMVDAERGRAEATRLAESVTASGGHAISPRLEVEEEDFEDWELSDREEEDRDSEADKDEIKAEDREYAEREGLLMGRS
ncbi:autophagy-related protein 22-2 [Lepidopterella palustris CBS 459.81]|uniref:Autophagy-related protein n=1 Tax=Lepidopterella palustris CBS 459.81 TaxID=1314670 RepID=A0A8E2EKU5_9PEZI|nr:autophagy-related protein 22-2 [Lepidopterella palustris CBS 459.81]